MSSDGKKLRYNELTIDFWYKSRLKHAWGWHLVWLVVQKFQAWSVGIKAEKEILLIAFPEVD